MHTCKWSWYLYYQYDYFHASHLGSQKCRQCTIIISTLSSLPFPLSCQYFHTKLYLLLIFFNIQLLLFVCTWVWCPTLENGQHRGDKKFKENYFSLYSSHQLTVTVQLEVRPWGPHCTFWSFHVLDLLQLLWIMNATHMSYSEQSSWIRMTFWWQERKKKFLRELKSQVICTFLLALGIYF